MLFSHPPDDQQGNVGILCWKAEPSTIEVAMAFYINTLAYSQWRGRR